MNTIVRSMVIAGLAYILVMGGCATPPEPFDYQSDNEIKPGPGLITGEQGAFVIYGEQEKPPSEEKPIGDVDSQAPASPAD